VTRAEANALVNGAGGVPYSSCFEFRDHAAANAGVISMKNGEPDQL
jgi:hypothetical protein